MTGQAIIMDDELFMDDKIIIMGGTTLSDWNICGVCCLLHLIINVFTHLALFIVVAV